MTCGPGSVRRIAVLGLVVGWAVSLGGILASTLGGRNLAAAERVPPNVILILLDDLGWRDVGFMANDFVETPQLDRLAERGLVFTQAYASAPNCAPTRACLLSGQYTPRHGVYTVSDPRQSSGAPWQRLLPAENRAELDPRVVTLAEVLRDAGYATGFFGMWNLGRGRTGPQTPGGQGFQTVVFPEQLGFGKDAYFDDERNYLSDRLTDEVLRFVERQRERPFFVYLADHAIHAPFSPPPDLLAKYERKAAARRATRDDPASAATVEAVDRNVGRIVEALSRWQLTDNTVVIFTSDNGGTPNTTAPLRGSKGQLYEGGIRVPLLFAGPGVTRPGTRCDVPVSSVDLYPTLLEWAGVAPPAGQPLDGVSLASLLRGNATWAPRRLFWHFPCYVGRATPASAIREGDDKLIEFFETPDRLELYDLRRDPAEQDNLADRFPERTRELAAALHAWQQETRAALPRQPNPAYDERARRPRGGPGKGASSGQR